MATRRSTRSSLAAGAELSGPLEPRKRSRRSEAVAPTPARRATKPTTKKAAGDPKDESPLEPQKTSPTKSSKGRGRAPKAAAKEAEPIFAVPSPPVPSVRSPSRQGRLLASDVESSVIDSSFTGGETRLPPFARSDSPN